MTFKYAVAIMLANPEETVYLIVGPIDRKNTTANKMYHDIIDTILHQVSDNFPGRGIIIDSINLINGEN